MKKIFATLFILGICSIGFAQETKSRTQMERSKTERPAASQEENQLFAYAILNVKFDEESEVMIIELEKEVKSEIESKASQITFDELLKLSERKLGANEELNILNFLGSYGWELVDIQRNAEKSKASARYYMKKLIK